MSQAEEGLRLPIPKKKPVPKAQAFLLSTEKAL